MPYAAGGEYHDSRRCRRAHATRDRVRRVEDTSDLDRCPRCVHGPDTCQTVKNDGEVCGREKPCPYHD